MAPVGVSLFSKLNFQPCPISENVWVYIPSLHTGSPLRSRTNFMIGSTNTSRNAFKNPKKLAAIFDGLP
jgi:hypothetical protein